MRIEAKSNYNQFCCLSSVSTTGIVHGALVLGDSSLLHGGLLDGGSLLLVLDLPVESYIRVSGICEGT